MRVSSGYANVLLAALALAVSSGKGVSATGGVVCLIEFYFSCDNVHLTLYQLTSCLHQLIHSPTLQKSFLRLRDRDMGQVGMLGMGGTVRLCLCVSILLSAAISCTYAIASQAVSLALPTKMS